MPNDPVTSEDLSSERAVPVDSAAESPGANDPGQGDGGESSTDGQTDSPVAVNRPEFVDFQGTPPTGSGTPLERFLDVNVTVWAELGRVQIPLGDLMRLGEGSVMQLERAVSAPVDLMAQGVRIARGEVVVVDDCFAIRIKEIESRGSRGG